MFKKTFKNKETGKETTFYYHNVLEAKLIAGDMVFSLGTEFIENENITKQDCERKAFYRLTKKLKKAFPRLKICVSADSLYAYDPVFKLCKKYKWEYIITYKSGSIPSVYEDYISLINMKGNKNKYSLDTEKTEIIYQ